MAFLTLILVEMGYAISCRNLKSNIINNVYEYIKNETAKKDYNNEILKIDKEIEEWERILQELAIEQEKAEIVFTVINIEDVEKSLAENPATKLDLDNHLDELNEKSKQLGNIRTGTLATSTVANIAGAVMSSTNKVKGDLKQQIDECLASVKTLSNVRMQARIDGSANDTELAHAENIIQACDAWTTVDISSINKRSTGATVSSGIGAGLGLAGTITSASANSKDIRDGDDEADECGKWYI